MRDSFTPEEVTRIEDKAYEVGVGIGASQERERIIALLETYWDEPCGTPFDPEHCVDCGTIGQLIALIKGEAA